MESVEQRLVTPFYLAMMGLNATEHAGDRWDDLVRVGRTATVTDVKQLLAGGAWRPVVMGAWLSVAFSPKDLGPDLLLAVTRCQGSFTAPPLSVAAYLVSGEFAMVEAAAATGAIDRASAIVEVLTSVHRAGADLVATYWATEVAGWLNGTER